MCRSKKLCERYFLLVSVPDVVKALADNKTDEAFNKAISEAAKQSVTSQDDFITLFITEYKKEAPQGKLAELFATQQLKDKVNTRSSDADEKRCCVKKSKLLSITLIMYCVPVSTALVWFSPIFRL